MGQDPDEKLSEIERTREALGEKVDALADQLRGGIKQARKTGMTVGMVAVGALVVLFTFKKLRNNKK